MMQLAPEFEEALPVIQKIEEAGFVAYFVGGSVRDTILKKPISDVDIATSAFPEEIKAVFLERLMWALSMGPLWFYGKRRV